MSGPRFFGAGAALLVLIFSVLCLTASALRALTVAASDRALAEKAASSVTDFYSADCLAAETAALLREALQSGEVPGEIGGIAVSTDENGCFCFSVPAGENRLLSVKLAEEDGALRIVSWRRTYSGEWSPDDSLKVWTGEENP